MNRGSSQKKFLGIDLPQLVLALYARGFMSSAVVACSSSFDLSCCQTLPVASENRATWQCFCLDSTLVTCKQP